MSVIRVISYRRPCVHQVIIPMSSVTFHSTVMSSFLDASDVLMSRSKVERGAVVFSVTWLPSSFLLRLSLSSTVFFCNVLSSTLKTNDL
jgi:hypothetical protein